MSKTFTSKYKRNSEKENNSVKERAKDLNNHLIKEDTHLANMHTKISSASYVTREMQIKTALRYHYTHLLEQPSSRTLAKPNTGEDIQQQASHLWLVRREMVEPLWKTDSLTKLNILIANNPAITLLGIYAKELKTHTHKNLHTDGL